MRFKGLAVALAAACVWVQPVCAQGAGPAFVDSKSPFFAVAVPGDEGSRVKMPNLTYTPAAEDAANYDKYFYFHRADTDFATAYGDIVECDGYARGLTSGLSPSYGQGILGDAIANAVADAIYGSANRRKLRRSNMRACMSFKGYDRYGLSKAIWQTFNFEEGNNSVDEDVRTGFLKQQALVASSARPEGKALGL